jgi:hypothetical protein
MPTAYNGAQTKVHFGGASSDVDIHLEIYDGEVDTRFQYQAIFKSLSSQRSVADRSNTYRIDRMNTSAVQGRVSGGTLNASRVLNDKLVLTVDTVLYIRNPIDYQDDWTSPDWLREMGQNNGSQFAETFDQAHIIQLIKCKNFVAPAHLKPAFSDGAEVLCALTTLETTIAQREANATAIGNAHKLAVQTLIKRKVPMGDIITLAYTDEFSRLLEHPKLLNTATESGQSAYADRRLTKLNGIQIVENTEFPTAAITGHVLGAAFDVTATEALVKVVVFSKSKTLVTVEAQPFTSRMWDDQLNFANVLDCYAMYTVGQRRPDTAVAIRCTYS